MVVSRNKGNVGTPHNPEVNRIKGGHRQDSGEETGNFKFRIDNSCDHASYNSGQHRK